MNFLYEIHKYVSIFFVNERVACLHHGNGEYWDSQCLSVLLWVQKSTENEIVLGLFINLVGMLFREN